MTLGEFIGIALVVSAPLTLALIISLVRGYDIDLRMTRDHTTHHWWSRRVPKSGDDHDEPEA